MFEKTRLKLIVMYSSLIVCILLIMLLLFYFLLSSTIAKSEEKQLNLTSQRILNEWKSKMPSNGTDEKTVNATYINYNFMPLNQFFVLTSDNGDVMFHSLRDETLLAFFKSTFKEQQIASNSPQYTTFTLQGGRAFKLFSIESPNNTVLYMGMEVTENVTLLSQMKWLLTLFAVLLLIVSIGVGYWFSKRAMIPIQRAYQRQQDFVSDASHELRTPLSIMQASIEIIEEEQNHLSPFHQKVLADMKEELTRTTQMLTGLLTLARSDSGRLEIMQEYFDLRELVASSVEKFKLLSAKIEIPISYTSSTDELLYYGDKERIKQLLYILIDNAIKYNKSTGEIKVSLLKNEKNAVLQIFDTGIGIPQEKIPYIFERFYRVNSGRSRAQGGVGLGLSIAGWIVKAHGGQIKVNSVLGEGTIVQIMLPI
ncbi:ATP-binding protein [Paenibacillus sp. GP183]|uniref:sensor histidine kinase n=1 Tax=Paenibacillus sp. GP183 TaxID=1882751 RepID=UPI0008981CB8|nr:ATP-binding protein [Paenibacillus sp. GP183]SEB83155.1 His Kinase A (phospho-acceptor) domain-containing protein [Paenibacillus sp. GP183]